ncbi:CDP-alcohol phosphatidyltransferase family protein [Pseudomonadota bacterium]
MQARDIPNLISILRVFLTIPVVWALLAQEYGLALVLFAVAGISDGVDGFLAKHFRWESRLGGMLDPLADKTLLVFSYLALGWLGLIPLWLVLAVILRDVIIVAGAVAYHLRVAELEAEPRLMSKVNTFMQILLVLLVVLSQALFALPLALLQAVIVLVLITTLLSGIDYIWIWSRRAVDQGSKSD